jgi:hypothetical protein
MKTFDEWLKSNDTDLYNEIAPLIAAAGRMLLPAAMDMAGKKLGGMVGGDKMKKQKKQNKQKKK